VALLRERLNEGTVHDRVRCLTIIASAELSEAFQDDLHRLSHDPDPGVRSTAIAALGTLQDATSRHLVRSALVDNDTRVQANAVDAIGASPEARDVDELILKLASPNNRVRANAVRALLRLGIRDAAKALLQMLDHPSRAQRVSALWLIDQLGLQTIMRRVGSLAEADPDENVRRRARSMCERSSAAAAETVQPAEAPA
jgi:HEAT repeat protein